MKIILSLLIAFSGLNLFAQKQGEVVVLRVEYAKKNSGIEHRMLLDAGTSTDHSLAKKIEHEKGVIRIQNNGKLLAFHNEVDLINFLISEGFSLHSTYQQTIMGETYQVYLFMRP